MNVSILAIKFEIVDGKKTGKSFSFELDPKVMAKHKTEATVRKKIEEYVIKSGVFRRDEMGEVKYQMKEFLEEWKKQISVVAAEEQEKLQSVQNNPGSRITPEHIDRLAPNEIFVFGSNGQGLHYGGAANAALLKFGAVMGQGHGLQGKSYAIDTMSGKDAMASDVLKFTKFAKEHSYLRFLVTPIGCGIAGYYASDVAPLFEGCKDLENVCLPKDFWSCLNVNK